MMFKTTNFIANDGFSYLLFTQKSIPQSSSSPQPSQHHYYYRHQQPWKLQLVYFSSFFRLIFITRKKIKKKCMFECCFVEIAINKQF